jgi:hypothetical protein
MIKSLTSPTPACDSNDDMDSVDNMDSVNEDKKPAAKIDADDDDAGWTRMRPNAKPV